MMRMLRYMLLAVAIVAGGRCTRTADADDAPTARRVIERIKTHVNCPWADRTVDTFKAGDPETPVTGIATTFMATQAVLEEAVAERCNLIVTHEPTFYTHTDRPSGLEGDPVLAAKRAFIEQHKLVIWRFHDHIHRHAPDMIDQGMIDAMGLRPYLVSQSPALFAVPETTVGRFAAQLKERLAARSVLIVGDANMRFTKVGFAAGSPGFPSQIALLRRDDVEVLLAGETRQWETVPYVQDASAHGRRKALILLGHANSEEAGMKAAADWLRGFIDEIPVKFIAAGDPFVEAK